MAETLMSKNSAAAAGFKDAEAYEHLMGALES
jgi:hypothetical protein